MTSSYGRISKNILECGMKLRPNANHGIWLIILLPVAVITCHYKYPQSAFFHYKLYAIFSFGMMLTSIVFVYQCANKKNVQLGASNTSLAAFICTLMYGAGQGFTFCLYSGMLSCFVFYKVYKLVLSLFPQSFSIGEAAVISQAVILFCYSTSMNLYKSIIDVPTKTTQIATLIIQIGLLGIGTMCFLAYSCKLFRKTLPFYFMFISGCFLFILVPLHAILKRSALLWIIEFIFEDLCTLRYVAYSGACSLVAALAINKQIKEAKKATTIGRKTFHILAIAVYVPGLLYKCTFIYLASGVVLGIFVTLEMMRLLNVPPLGITLQDGFSVFCDDKDSGPIALTPIYLLTSVSLPLWIHPVPCDITDSATYNLYPLLSGVLSVGIGDTFASICGKLFGRFQWPGTNKTIEGTLGCIVSQIAIIYILMYSGVVHYCQYEILKAGIAIVITSFIEAFTSQVDNLALPLLMFIILL